MPRPPLETLEQALAYIEVLEDALKPFAPFAAAASLPMEAEMRNVTPEQVQALRRDTCYFDMSAFHRAAELTRGLG
jgi:hypothetical protein